MNALRVPGLSVWVHSPLLWRRLAGTAAILGLAIGLSVAVARPMFSAEYNGAQSEPATSLAARSPAVLARLRKEAWRDLYLLIPVYTTVTLAALGLVQPDRRTTLPRTLMAIAFGSITFTAIADVVETLRFRSALDRLLHGATAAAITDYVETTGVWTFLKLAGVVVTLIVVGLNAAAGG